MFTFEPPRAGLASIETPGRSPILASLVSRSLLCLRRRIKQKLAKRHTKPMTPSATPTPIPTAVPVARPDVGALADLGDGVEELVGVGVGEFDVVEDSVDVLVSDACLIFQPTMAIAPTVDESADTVVVMIDQTEPSSVYANIPEYPLVTSDKQAPVTLPASPSVR